MYDKEEYARDLRRQMEESRARKEAQKRLLLEEDLKYLSPRNTQAVQPRQTAGVLQRVVHISSPRNHSPRVAVDLDVDRLKRELEDKRTENRNLIAKIRDKLGHVLVPLDSPSACCVGYSVVKIGGEILESIEAVLRLLCPGAKNELIGFGVMLGNVALVLAESLNICKTPAVLACVLLTLKLSDFSPGRPSINAIRKAFVQKNIDKQGVSESWETILGCATSVEFAILNYSGLRVDLRLPLNCIEDVTIDMPSLKLREFAIRPAKFFAHQACYTRVVVCNYAETIAAAAWRYAYLMRDVDMVPCEFEQADLDEIIVQVCTEMKLSNPLEPRPRGLKGFWSCSLV